MTKLLTWREEWSLGIEPLDRDHRALIERMGDLCVRHGPELAGPRLARPQDTLTRSAFARLGGASAGLLPDLADLGERMRAHFRREVAFMRAIRYERSGQHEGEHAILMAEYTAMLRGWQERDLRVFDEATQEGVRRWLLDHILGSDREFARFYFRICGQNGFEARHA